MLVVIATIQKVVKLHVHFHLVVKMAIIFIFACCGVSLAPNVVLTTPVFMAHETPTIQIDIIPAFPHLQPNPFYCLDCQCEHMLLGLTILPFPSTPYPPCH